MFAVQDNVDRVQNVSQHTNSLYQDNSVSAYGFRLIKRSKESNRLLSREQNRRLVLVSDEVVHRDDHYGQAENQSAAILGAGTANRILIQDINHLVGENRSER
jgi:hypothetical protein